MPRNLLNMLDYQALSIILDEWSFDKRPVPVSVPRRVLDSLPSWTPDIALVIQGVRRCGKSTLLAQIMTHQKLSPESCTFVNFEDPRLADHLNFGTLDAIVEISHQRAARESFHYFFLDEIHHVAGWEKWLHSRLERPGREYFALTGSNAALLASEFSTALTGRHRTIEMFPFDLPESEALIPGITIVEHMRRGGFPRVLTYDEPQALLREYFSDIIERDIRGRVNVRSTTTLTRLAKAVFESMGSEVSLRSLAGLLGVTADTAGVYLDACADSYLILPCPYFTFSERQQTARPRKYYPIDIALRDAVVTKTGRDLGKRLEAAVFLHLRRKRRDVYFWRGRGEIDFVVQDADGITPVQVSWDGPKERHERASAEFRKAFPEANPVMFVSRDNATDLLRG